MRKIFNLALFTLICANSFSQGTYVQEKWKVIVFPFLAISPKAEDISVVIPKSLEASLKDVEHFEVHLSKKRFKSREEAQKYAYLQGYDIVIWGETDIRKGKVFVYVKAFDIISGITKLENFYEGKAGIDVFETIDRIIAELKTDLLKKVKPMTREIIIKYRTRRILVSREIKLKRIFKTYYGLCFSEPFNINPYAEYDVYLSHLNFSFKFELPLVIPSLYIGYLKDKGLVGEDAENLLLGGGISFPEIALGYKFQNTTFDIAFIMHFSSLSTYQEQKDNIDGQLLGLKIKHDFSSKFTGKMGIYYNLDSYEEYQDEYSYEIRRTYPPVVVFLGADYMFDRTMGISVELVPIIMFLENRETFREENRSITESYKKYTHNIQLFIGFLKRINF